MFVPCQEKSQQNYNLTASNKSSESDVNIFGDTFTSENAFTRKVRLRAY
jgi:hypothetical protein